MSLKGLAIFGGVLEGKLFDKNPSRNFVLLFVGERERVVNTIIVLYKAANILIYIILLLEKQENNE